MKMDNVDRLLEPEARAIAQAKFDLFLWQYENCSSFSCKLFDLIGKADIHNKLKLGEVFPEHVAVWDMWQFSNNDKNFWQSCKDAIKNVEREYEQTSKNLNLV